MSDAKSVIFSRIRESLKDVPDMAADADTPIEWVYGQPTAMPDVVDRFVENILDYKAAIEECPVAQVPQQIVAGLTQLEVDSVVVPPGLEQSWVDAIRDAGITVFVDDGKLSSAQLNQIGGVVTAAAVGVAETGTIVLDHDDNQGRRVLTLVPDNHICVVADHQIVSDVPEMMQLTIPAIRAGRPMTWISGGSATSDIELSRVEGVHGPRKLYVVLARTNPKT